MLVVGLAEPEIQPWVRAAGHAVRAVRDVRSALAALDEDPADLVIVDREPGGLDVPGVCRKLREDHRADDAWLLALTIAASKRTADAALDAGADDYLHRPFTRAELLARARAGLRAAQQRADDAIVRALMVNVPGAIYRSAWHANFTLELISDEIERISGYPAANFIASKKRTLWSIVHPDDRPKIQAELNDARDDGEPFGLEYRIVLRRRRGALGARPRPARVRLRRPAVVRRRDLRHDRAPRRRGGGARPRDRAGPQRGAARLAGAHRRGGRRRAPQDRARPARRRAAAARRAGARGAHGAGRVDKDPELAGPFLERVGKELTDASAELRELARGIHPAVLTERGLAPAISALVSRAPLPVDLVGLPEDRLPPATEATAYFTVAEALTNVAKYAEASHASVRMERENGVFAVEVRDDGKGGAQASPGSGLSGLADRVGAADGTLTITSPPGDGTIVRAELPLPA